MEVKGESQNIRPNPKPVGSACALCRKRKRKCDESVPCRHCKKANTLCERPPAPFRSACVACRELHGKCNKGVRSCQYCKNANILCVRLKAQDSEPSKSEDMAPLREEAHHSGQPRSVVLTSPGIGRSVGTDHQKSSMTDIVTLTPLVVHLPTPSNTPSPDATWSAPIAATDPADATGNLQRIAQDSVQLITQAANVSDSSNGSTPETTMHRNSSPSAAPANNGRAEQPGQKNSGVNNPQILIPQPPPFSSNPLKRPGEDFGDVEKLKRIQAENREGMKRIKESRRRIAEKRRALIDRGEQLGREIEVEVKRLQGIEAELQESDSLDTPL